MSEGGWQGGHEESLERKVVRGLTGQRNVDNTKITTSSVVFFVLFYHEVKTWQWALAV